MDDAVIELRNVGKKYDDFTAVKDLNLTVFKGEIFGFLGPNGAGKSTSILMMLGLTEPSSGEVRVCGLDSTSQPIEVKKRVGYLPEDVGFYDDMSARENLMYIARLNGICDEVARSRVSELLGRVGLAAVADKKVGKFSKGMRQRLGLADVLIKNPEVIILDEPTSGIDPKGVKELLQVIVALRDEHQITVLFSSHNLHQVQQVCDRVGIFVEGHMLAQGTVAELSKQLFGKSEYTIDLQLEKTFYVNEEAKNLASFMQILDKVEGVVCVTLNKQLFHIECVRDLSSDLSKTIAEAGYGIVQLLHKQYGLDEIYSRYFDGGV